MSKATDKRKVPGELLVCSNNKALHDYDIEERLEAGIVLRGSEVKSMRAKRCDLEGAYAALRDNELFLNGMHVGPYEQAGRFGHEAKYPRKLLVHKHEIHKLAGRLGEQGYTLVPLRVYFKEGRAKVELGLGKGRKHRDRRQEIKRDLDLREAREAIDKSRTRRR
jgi:SsrA-binding protein